MKKTMILMTLIALAGLLAASAAYHFTHNGVMLSLTITLGTVFYHLSMRLAVGYIIDAKYHNQMDYTISWFRQREFEKGLYDKLHVKKWKKHLPTFNAGYFNLKNHSAQELVGATCQAEVVHEINMLLSFVPLIFALFFGDLGVFLITSCLAALFDGVFVIIQRYNRPRLIRLIKR